MSNENRNDIGDEVRETVRRINEISLGISPLLKFEEMSQPLTLPEGIFFAGDDAMSLRSKGLIRPYPEQMPESVTQQFTSLLQIGPMNPPKPVSYANLGDLPINIEGLVRDWQNNQGSVTTGGTVWNFAELDARIKLVQHSLTDLLVTCEKLLVFAMLGKSDEEAHFMKICMNGDREAGSVYADWLEEQGRTADSVRVRASMGMQKDV